MLMKRDSSAPEKCPEPTPPRENSEADEIAHENPSAESWLPEIGRWRADAAK